MYEVYLYIVKVRRYLGLHAFVHLNLGTRRLREDADEGFHVGAKSLGDSGGVELLGLLYRESVIHLLPDAPPPREHDKRKEGWVGVLHDLCGKYVVLRTKRCPAGD